MTDKHWNIIDDAELTKLVASWTPILVRKESASYSECLIWCLKYSQGRFVDRSWDNNRLWYFEDERDAVLFAMQFGG